MIATESQAERSARADAFVRRHFRWPGTLRLHAAALGGDILRAPANVLLAPLFVAVRLLAWACRRAGLHGPAGWLGRRRILLRTAVSRRVEALVVAELLGLPLAPAPARRPADGEAIRRAILSAPHWRAAIRNSASPDAADAMADRIAAALADYAGTRAAVAEMTTALVALAVGALAFQALTPGMISMAPGVAGVVSHHAAVAGFPLGEGLGRLWYGVFPVGAAPWLVAVTVLALVLLGATVAAFAGVLADPVQARLGIHHRRLLRLLDTLDAALAGGERPFAAHEHVYARALDLWDVVASLLRLWRG